MMGAISSIVLVILKYNGKQGWKVYPCIIYIGAKNKIYTGLVELNIIDAHNKRNTI